MLVTYNGADACMAFDEIRKRCTVLTHNGSDCPYNPLTKTIESRKTSSEHTEVYSVVTLTEDKMVVIVPYHVARTLSYVQLGPPIPKSVLNVVFKGTLRDYQVEGTGKVIEALQTVGHCYLQAPPAYGKTVLMSWVIAHFKERTLIVVPCLSLADQTKTSINMMLPGIKVHILETEGGERVIPEDTDVLISFIRRLCGPALKTFGTVIFDEVHQLSTTIGVAAMLTVRPNHLLALTATPGDRNQITELFVGKCSIRELTDKRWSICFPRITAGLSGEKYSGVEGYTEAMTDLVNSQFFAPTIARMVRYFVGIGKRIIVITMRCEMSQKLGSLLEEKVDDKGVEYTLLSYAVLTRDNRTCPNCDVIIGTHKLIGTGFDLSNYVDNFDGKCASVMIFLGSIKNRTLMYQAAGRGFRDKDPLAVYPTISDLPVSNTHRQALRKEAQRTDGCVILETYASFLESFSE